MMSSRFPMKIPTPLRFSIAVILGCSIVSLTGYARGLKEIKETHELRICDPSSTDSTQAEVALLFAQSLGGGVKGKITKIKWDQQFHNKDGKTVQDATYTPELLASGTCDVYATGMDKNEWRSKKLDIVTLYASRSMILVNKQNRGKITKISDLGNRKAAVQKDTSYHNWINEQNAGILAKNPVTLEFMSTRDALAAVDAGKADFSLAESLLGIWFTNKQYKSLVAAFPVGPVFETGWGFRKEDKDLQASARKFFDEQTSAADTSLNKLWEQNFGIKYNEFVALVSEVQ